ncbi:MAG: LPS-assembly protein LptD [Desulfobacterales bacterium]|nr:MAG: LPS-assembly protein LptD [Desulfobacterales bacterium]
MSSHPVSIASLGALIAFILSWSLVLVPSPSHANEFNKLFSEDAEQPWRLEADEVSYDQTSDQYMARGNVVIYRGDRKLTADFIRFDHQRMKAYAEGNVVLRSGADILSGSRMDIDLESQLGTVENGHIFIRANNYHLTGNRIEKLGEDSYRIDKATITTCDGDLPDWKITAQDVKVTVEGYGTAKHATLWARNLPVMYTPYFFYPAKRDRQSGFLMPELGYSKRKGAEYKQPFFWAIDESSDATFYGYYMSDRGPKLGLEYRYILSEDAKGALMVDYFRDDKVDDGTGDSSSRYGFEDEPVDFLRTNNDRYWARMSHHQKVPLDFSAKLDLDVVSDQDYLREFRDGYMGYKPTDAYFRTQFGRQIDDYNDPIRLNRFNLNRIWPKYSLNIDTRWQDDVIKRRQGDKDDTLQRLPVVDFRGAKQPLLDGPLFFDFASQYNYFWRESGPRGQRIDLYPRFYWPYRIRNYFTIEPSIGLRETTWYLDKSEFSRASDSAQAFHRELFDTRLQLNSEISRVFDIDSDTVPHVKHTILPRLIHEFMPGEDQSELPKFDGVDRIKGKNLITCALTNILTSKSRKKAVRPAPQPDEVQATPIDLPAEYDYNQFFRLELKQGFDIKEAYEDDPEDQEHRRPFLPIAADLDIRPGKYFAVDANAQWSVYENSLLSSNLALTIWDQRGDRLSVQHHLTKNSDELVDDEEDEALEASQTVYTDLEVKITERLKAFANYERNLKDNIRIQTGVGFLYQAQCWSILARYIDEPNDFKYELTINLFGLGGFGL